VAPTVAAVDWEAMAKLSLVLIFMIETLNTVVSSATFLSFWALFSVGELAELSSIDSILPTAVLEAVIEEAALMIMRRLLSGALDSFEPCQIKMPNLN
jgi:hypothetical protein